MIPTIFAVLVAVIAIIALVSIARGGSKAPAAGSPALDFTLNSQEGKPVSLHDFKGQWVVLYFYPKDFTSGCTIEARNFQRDIAQFEAKNAVILGVSTQDEKTHHDFCAKEGLNFKLLADIKKVVSTQYGSIMNLAIAKLSARHTFLIDPQGVIQKVYLDVDAPKHSAEVLVALDELQKKP